MERESSAFPEWAWPQPGDRVQALGSWVWDCDHYQGAGREDGVPSVPGRVDRALCVAARSAALVGRRSLRLDRRDARRPGSGVRAPDEGLGPVQVLRARLPRLAVGERRLRLRPAGAHGDVRPAGDPDGRPRQLQRRRRSARRGRARPGTSASRSPRPRASVCSSRASSSPPARNAPAIDHLRLHFDKLLVRRAMDPSCAPDKPACPYANESTLLGQIASAPGEWQLEWSVDGIWGRWPGTLAAKDGSTFAGKQSVDFYLQRGKPWTFVALARECDFGALPGWDGPGHPTAPCPVSNEVGQRERRRLPGRDHADLSRRRARPARVERVNRRLDVPVVERQRVLPTDVHSQSCALTGKGSP